MPRTPKPGSAAAFGKLLEAQDRLDAEAIAEVFGPLPDWLPEPALLQIRQELAVLRNLTEQPPDRIAALVAQAGRSELEYTGSVRDVTAFTQAAHNLARIKWALSLPKADAIRALGGRLAALNYQRSRAARAAQYGSDEKLAKRDRAIRYRAQQLAAENPAISSNAQAAALAPEFKLSTRQIKRVLKG